MSSQVLIARKKPDWDHVHSRDYSAGRGRWTRQDPLGYVDGMSLYQYVQSTPTDQLDPFGLVGGYEAQTPADEEAYAGYPRPGQPAEPSDTYGQGYNTLTPADEVGYGLIVWTRPDCPTIDNLLIGIVQVAGVVWTSPNTLLGLGLGLAGLPFGGDPPTLGNHAIQFTNNRIFAAVSDNTGITLGNVTVYPPGQFPENIWEFYDGSGRLVYAGNHEGVHVTHQFMVFGPFFLPIYLIAELCPGDVNPFEQQADEVGQAQNPPPGDAGGPDQ